MVDALVMAVSYFKVPPPEPMVNVVGGAPLNELMGKPPENEGSRNVAPLLIEIVLPSVADCPSNGPTMTLTELNLRVPPLMTMALRLIMPVF